MERIKLIVVLALCFGVAAQVLAQETPWRALNQEAMKLYREGKYAEASTIAERALDVAEKTFRPDHPSVATALNNLALLYRHKGMSAEAECHFKRSLATFEQALGKDHPHVAVSLGNLGHVYRDRGDHSEALRMFQRSLKIFKSKGIPHGWPQNLIAALYLDQEDIAAAESSISDAGSAWLRGDYAC